MFVALPPYRQEAWTDQLNPFQQRLGVEVFKDERGGPHGN